MWIYREFSVNQAPLFATQSRPVFVVAASRCDSSFTAGRRARAMPGPTRPSSKQLSVGGNGSSSSRVVRSNRFMTLPRPKASPIAMWLT